MISTSASSSSLTGAFPATISALLSAPSSSESGTTDAVETGDAPRTIGGGPIADLTCAASAWGSRTASGSKVAVSGDAGGCSSNAEGANPPATGRAAVSSNAYPGAAMAAPGAERSELSAILEASGAGSPDPLARGAGSLLGLSRFEKFIGRVACAYDASSSAGTRGTTRVDKVRDATCSNTATATRGAS